MSNYEVELIEDGDDLILPFPDGLLDEMGWEVGDDLEWTVEDGRVTIRKKQQMELF